MKKLFFAAATVFCFAAFQSCSPKCGHCHYEVTTGSNTNKSDDDVICGDVGSQGNESGAYYKSEKLNCEKWAADQTPVTGVTYSATWEADK